MTTTRHGKSIRLIDIHSDFLDYSEEYPDFKDLKE